jgi:hypothetical protein
MGWWVDKQPDGKYAIFSSVVDDFVVTDMTQEEAFKTCVERLIDIERVRRDAQNMVARADENPERWATDCATHDRVYRKMTP